jgi:predicted MFS family arabinose efflux permease
LICTLFPAVVVRITGPRMAARGITVVFTATSLGAAFGAPLASIVGNALGWRVTFVAAAALALVAGVLMSFSLPRGRSTPSKSLSLLETVRLPGVLRTAVAWSLVMLANFVVLTYIQAYLEAFEVPAYMTSVSLFLVGAGGIIGTLLVGRISGRSTYAALVITPALVGAGFVLLLLGGSNLAIVIAAIAIWGIGIAATVVIYQQVILLTGARAPESATSIGVLLAQAGFAAGASVGGGTIELLGVRAIPLVALAFVLGSIAIALTLRRTVHTAEELSRPSSPERGARELVAQ